MRQESIIHRYTLQNVRDTTRTFQSGLDIRAGFTRERPIDHPLDRPARESADFVFPACLEAPFSVRNRNHFYEIERSRCSLKSGIVRWYSDVTSGDEKR